MVAWRRGVAAAFHAVVEELKLGAVAVGVGLLLGRHHPGAAQGLDCWSQEDKGARGCCEEVRHCAVSLATVASVAPAFCHAVPARRQTGAGGKSEPTSAKQSSVPIGDGVRHVRPVVLPK